jgi:hypothetical protein
VKKVLHFIGLKLFEILAVVAIFFVIKYGIELVGYLFSFIPFAGIFEVIFYIGITIGLFLLGILASSYTYEETVIKTILIALLFILAVPLALYTIFWAIVANAFLCEYILYLFGVAELTTFVSHQLLMYFLCGIFFLVVQTVSGFVLYGWLKLNYLIVKYKNKENNYFDAIDMALRRWN